jgi:predicted HicB family RNase H-like nuclease
VNGHFEYKGYIGSAEVDVQGGALVGKLLYIRDTITYSATSVPELESAFHEAVDDYLATCAEEASEPDSPCKGSFNVRIGPERHRSVAIAALRMGVGLNDFVCKALDSVIQPAPHQTILHRHEVRVVQTTSTGDPKQWTLTTASHGPNWNLDNDAASKH